MRQAYDAVGEVAELMKSNKLSLWLENYPPEDYEYVTKSDSDEPPPLLLLLLLFSPSTAAVATITVRRLHHQRPPPCALSSPLSYRYATKKIAGPFCGMRAMVLKFR